MNSSFSPPMKIMYTIFPVLVFFIIFSLMLAGCGPKLSVPEMITDPVGSNCKRDPSVVFVTDQTFELSINVIKEIAEGVKLNYSTKTQTIKILSDFGKNLAITNWAICAQTFNGIIATTEQQLYLRDLLYFYASDPSPDQVIKYIEATSYPARSLVPNSVSVKSESPSLVEISNTFDEVIWTHVYEGEVANSEAFLEDFDGDGLMEVVVGIGNGGADQGYIINHEQQPNGEWVEVWRFNMYEESPYGCSQCATKHTVTGIQVSSSLKRSPEKWIIAVSRDANGWLPSRLVVINGAGDLEGELWHGGVLSREMLIEDFDGDGLNELAVFGSNNDARQLWFADGSNTNFHGVFMLDIENVGGTAPPGPLSSGLGTHKWYKLVFPQEGRISRLTSADFDNDGILDLGVWLTCGFEIFVNHLGNVIGGASADNAACGPSDTFLSPLGYHF